MPKRTDGAAETGGRARAWQSTSRSTRVRSLGESRRSLCRATTHRRRPGMRRRRSRPATAADGAGRPIRASTSSTGRSSDAGYPFEDVRARVGEQTDGTYGLFATGLEVPPQGLGDLGPSGGVASPQPALFALLGEPTAELDPLLRFVHAPACRFSAAESSRSASRATSRGTGSGACHVPLRPTGGGRSGVADRARDRRGGDWTGRESTTPGRRYPSRRPRRGRPRPHPARRPGCSSCRPGTTAARR